MKQLTPRTILTDVCGRFAMNIAMLPAFRSIGFGCRGEGILLNPDVQSRKLIAVWTGRERLPIVVNNPVPRAQCPRRPSHRYRWRTSLSQTYLHTMRINYRQWEG